MFPGLAVVYCTKVGSVYDSAMTTTISMRFISYSTCFSIEAC